MLYFLIFLFSEYTNIKFAEELCENIEMIVALLSKAQSYGTRYTAHTCKGMKLTIRTMNSVTYCRLN